MSDFKVGDEVKVLKKLGSDLVDDGERQTIQFMYKVDETIFISGDSTAYDFDGKTYRENPDFYSEIVKVKK